MKFDTKHKLQNRAVQMFWKDLHKDGITRAGFLDEKRDLVNMFVDPYALKAIEEAIACKKDIPLNHIKTVIDGKLGAQLFEIEGYNVEWARIVRRLYTLL